MKHIDTDENRLREKKIRDDEELYGKCLKCCVCNEVDSKNFL